jgi:thioredoxin-like negative regulator of GroEL
MRSDIFNLVLLTGLCCLLLASHPAAAQADAAAAQEHLRAASEAYREGDLEGLTAALETAAELNPFSLYTRYNLACGYARTGRDAEALDILQGLVAARVDFGMADDEEMTRISNPCAIIRNSPGWSGCSSNVSNRYS